MLNSSVLIRGHSTTIYNCVHTHALLFQDVFALMTLPLLLHIHTQLQVWKATVYLTPLLGAYMADAVMGRFWVILVFSIVYFLVSSRAAYHSQSIATQSALH